MERSQNLDIIKGIGIILVVLGHCGCPAAHFIYLFHMAIFFIASGYVLNSAYSDNFANFRTLFRKRLKALWLPCFFFNTLFLLLAGTFIKYDIYPADVKTAPTIASGILLNALLYLKGGPLAGACWFLGTLFEVTVIYALVDYLLKRIRVRFREILNLVLGLAMFLVSFNLIQRGIRIHSIVEHIAGAYVMFAAGVLLKRLPLNAISPQKWGLIFVGAFAVLFLCNQYGSIEVSMGVYTDWWFYLLCSIAGWFFVYGASVWVNRSSLATNALCYLGRNTICIIGLHFLAFKIVAYFQIWLYGLPHEKLSVHPVLISEPFWWVAYTVVGVGVPLVLNMGYKAAKRKVFH
jgi:fucose 4-O-acetylase-like acetyltransferase